VTDYYLDASALVKRYVDEKGSAWVRQITDRSAQNTILLAEITLIDRAVELTQNHRLRGYDSVQLGVALVINDLLKTQNSLSPVFVAADKDLVAAADAEQLPVENLLEHQ
jgi:hypothetical protein